MDDQYEPRKFQTPYAHNFLKYNEKDFKSYLKYLQ